MSGLGVFGVLCALALPETRDRELDGPPGAAPALRGNPRPGRVVGVWFVRWVGARSSRSLVPRPRGAAVGRGRRPAGHLGRRSLRAARPHPFAASDRRRWRRCTRASRPRSPCCCPRAPAGRWPRPSWCAPRAGAAARGAPVLRPWTVPALAVDAGELADPAEEARYGASVAHLRALVELADDLAPAAGCCPRWRGGRRARARWRPVVRGLDAVAFDALVEALPPVGRAEHAAPRDERGADPQALVDDALAVLTDAAVRDRLARAGRHPGAAGPAAAAAPRSPGLAARAHRARRPVGGGGRAASWRRSPTRCAEWDRVRHAPAGRRAGELPARRGAHAARPGRSGRDPDDQTGDGTHWILEFFLQSTADPSLLVPAAQVWDGRAARLLADPQELLLAELGPRRARAARSRPRAARRPARRRSTWSTAAPTSSSPSTRRCSPTPGSACSCPAGWDGSRARRAHALGAQHPGRSGAHPQRARPRDAGRFPWSIAVGDEELAEEELAELVAAKARSCGCAAAGSSVDAEQLGRGWSSCAAARRGGRPTVGEVLALARPHPTTGPPTRRSRCPSPRSHEGCLGDLLAGRADRAITPVPPPPGSWPSCAPTSSGACPGWPSCPRWGLAPAWPTTWAWARPSSCSRWRPRAGPGRAATLLMCPMSLVGTWQREAARFAPELRVHAHHGPGRPHGAALHAAMAAADLVVTTYATAARDAEELAGSAWRRLVLDEAQAIKNSRATAARAVRRFDAEHRVASPAPRWRTGCRSCGR